MLKGLSGKNTSKEGTTRKGASTHRRFHCFLWSSGSNIMLLCFSLFIKDTTGGLWSWSSQAFNLVSLEQSHHKPISPADRWHRRSILAGNLKLCDKTYIPIWPNLAPHKLWHFLPEVNNMPYFWHLSAGLYGTALMKQGLLAWWRWAWWTPRGGLNHDETGWMLISSWN